MSWLFGSCNNNQQYQNDQEYDQTCCFLTSPTNWVFQLNCKDSYGDGWHGAFITINGKDYCRDFLTGREETVYVEANPSKF